VYSPAEASVYIPCAAAAIHRAAVGTVLVLLVIAFPASAHDARSILFNEAEALGYSQQAMGRVVTDEDFVDADRHPVRLSDFRGKPAVLNMIYTSCMDICPLIIERVADAVASADKALGAGRFAVLTVGFDTHADTPARLRDYRAAHRIERPGWLLLSTDAGSVARLAADVGFLFAPRGGGFDHLAQTTLLDADGRVYRQIYGSDFAVPALVEPLKQLVLGNPGSFLSISALTNRVRLLCTIYDPATGRYRFSYAIFVGLAVGAASLALVAAFLVQMWRTRRA
jgi:protein SCO1